MNIIRISLCFIIIYKEETGILYKILSCSEGIPFQQIENYKNSYYQFTNYNYFKLQK